MDIKIRNISPQVISEIDKIAKQADYVKCNDDFLINILPAIVRALVNSELERLSEGAKTTINNVYIAAQKMMKTTEKIDNLLTETLKNSTENSITNDEILRILEISDKDNS